MRVDHYSRPRAREAAHRVGRGSVPGGKTSGRARRAKPGPAGVKARLLKAGKRRCNASYPNGTNNKVFRKDWVVVNVETEPV